MTRAEKRRELLERLEGKLPSAECTDFNLDRWLDAYEDDVTKCVEWIGEYLKNRKALGLDKPEGFDGFFSRPDMLRYYGVFTQSKPMTSWINSYDNGMVFVETGVSDALKACKVIRSGDFLHCFMRSCEFFLQLVLENEKKTGKRSYGVCIFDMGQMAILQYVNPMAPINRIFEARVGILMSFYSEMLSQVVIVNPPRILSPLMKIMSILLPAKVLSRFNIATTHLDIQKWISPDAIPMAFGGTKVIENADCPETGCNASLEYGKDEFLRDGEIWERHGIHGVQYEHCLIGAGECYVKELEAKKGQTLVYEYFANRNFEIRVENDVGEYLLPRIKMCSPLLAEEGAVKIERDGQVKWELKNLSRMMRMKLKIALRLID